MADTLPNIPIPAGTFVDLYAESGITVGTKISIENVGAAEIRYFTRATAPSDPSSTGYQLLIPYATKQNQTSDSGAFAWSIRPGLVNVRVA